MLSYRDVYAVFGGLQACIERFKCHSAVEDLAHFAVLAHEDAALCVLFGVPYVDQHAIEGRYVDEPRQKPATEGVLLLFTESGRENIQGDAVVTCGDGRGAMFLFGGVDADGQILTETSVGIFQRVAEVCAVDIQPPDAVFFLFGYSMKK